MMKLPKRFLICIPNFLTLCNSLCGFAAILYSLSVYEHAAKADNSMVVLDVLSSCAWIILFAMVFDALDGFVARLLNASSLHGLQMDSLADMVTFGLAPAVITAIMTHWLTLNKGSWFSSAVVTYILCAVYVGCAALRLATYNVHALLEKKSSDLFTGLPSPGAAAGVCSVVLVWEFFYDKLQPLAIWLPVYAAVLGLLMVSPIPYFHVGKYLASLKRRPKRGFLVALIIVIIIAAKLPGLVVLLNLYIFSAPVIWLYKIFRNLHRTQEGAAE